MTAERERRDDAEVAASAAQRPEELRLALRVGLDDRAVGEHDRRRHEVVDREPHSPRQVSHAAAERQPADAGGADDPDRNGQAVLMRGLEQILEQRSAADPRHLRRRVDLDRVHLREVDHEPVVDGAETARRCGRRRERRSAGRARCRSAAPPRRPPRRRSRRSRPAACRSSRCRARAPRRSRRAPARRRVPLPPTRAPRRKQPSLLPCSVAGRCYAALVRMGTKIRPAMLTSRGAALPRAARARRSGCRRRTAPSCSACT